jgi:hypothetical protein
MAIAEAPSEHDDAHAPAATTNGAGSDRDAIIKAAATIGVIGVGVALIEVALIPGMVIGVAAALAPKYLPQINAGLQPLFKSTVRGAYKLSRKTRAAVAEAHEQVQDIVAEVHAENRTPAQTAAQPEA